LDNHFIVGTNKEKHWNFDDASIFAQIDAFVQRCKDLLEVCEGQIQFARKGRVTASDGKISLPVFGGSRGTEITKSLYDIEAAR
jgi:dynein heavy chain